MVPIKIVSGGETGVDRGALDAAIALDIPHGGWCPKGRRAEDGRIPAKYKLQETSSRNHLNQTARNVYDSDATLIFTLGTVSGGTKKTVEIARARGKDFYVCNLKSASPAQAVQSISTWLNNQIEQHKQVTPAAPFNLNVAGPRASRQPRLQKAATRILTQALSQSLGIESTQRGQPAPANRRSLNPAGGGKDAKVLQR